MFGFFKRLLAQKNAVAEDIATLLDAEDRKWREMSADDLFALDDTDLVSAVISRVFGSFGSCEDEQDRIAMMNGDQRVIYTVYTYESEVNNGGLCQYLSNDSRFFAPMLCEALKTIGDTVHYAHFAAFVRDNAIDLSGLDSFGKDAIRRYEKLEKRYPFEPFDDAFYEMPSLEAPMAAYIRARIVSF